MHRSTELIEDITSELVNSSSATWDQQNRPRKTMGFGRLEEPSCVWGCDQDIVTATTLFEILLTNVVVAGILLLIRKSSESPGQEDKVHHWAQSNPLSPPLPLESMPRSPSPCAKIDSSFSLPPPLSPSPFRNNPRLYFLRHRKSRVGPARCDSTL